MKSSPVRVGDWLSAARRIFESFPADPGGRTFQETSLDQQVLLAQVLERPRAWLLAHPEQILSPTQLSKAEDLLDRLAKGTPLPYLTGSQEFYGLEFEVSPDVLIPRPETELLVERALDWLRRHPDRRRAADVGTGSGCIAVSLARYSPGLHILAVDRSWKALQIAQRNARKHGVEPQISCLQADLLSAASGPFDLVCANLPYIPGSVLHGLPVARYEPSKALDGGPDGLSFIRGLLADAPRWLAPSSLLLLEMQFDQGEAITALARACLPQAKITVHPDLAHRPRLVEIEQEASEN